MLNNPRTLEEFFDTLPIRTCSWRIRTVRQTEGLGNAQIIDLDLSPELWMATFTVTVPNHAKARVIRARINSLLRTDMRFLAYDAMMPYPLSDRVGAQIFPASPQVNSIGANFDTLSLKGVPANYVFTTGDKGVILYASAPQRRFMFEFSEDAIANGSGVTPVVSIRPHIRAGITVNDAVILYKPPIAMKLLSEAYDSGTANPESYSDISFDAIEKVI